jgi:hypothetical protein
MAGRAGNTTTALPDKPERRWNAELTGSFNGPTSTGTVPFPLLIDEQTKVVSRVVTTYDGAKRLVLNLAKAVQAWEQRYGQIELDFAKRGAAETPPLPRPGDFVAGCPPSPVLFKATTAFAARRKNHGSRPEWLGVQAIQPPPCRTNPSGDEMPS